MNMIMEIMIWIAKDNNPNEWAIAYHGTSTSAV